MTVEHEVTERLPFDLATERAGKTQWENRDVAYEVAVAGLPFLSAASAQSPLRRGFAEAQKEQISTSDEPGDNSFSNWWIASQVSWVGGAGNLLLEKEDETNLRPWTRFRRSLGVNPWNLAGDVRLLNRCQGVEGGDEGRVVTESPTTALFASGTTVMRVNADGTVDTHSVAGTAVLDLEMFEGQVCLAQGATVQQPAAGPWPATIPLTPRWTGAPAAVTDLWAVKRRLIAASGGDLYELGAASPAAWPATPLVEGPPGWTWTGVAETPDALLLAGHDGSRSSVYALTLDRATGEVPTLSAPYTVADLPPGELVMSIGSYLGSVVVLGTTRGARVGKIGEGGQLLYGPLTVETGSPVRSITFFDRFAWVTVEGSHEDGGSGLARIDVSNPTDEQGRFAWADDLRAPGATQVFSVAPVGTTGLMCMATDDGLFVEQPDDPEEQGWIESSQIRFATLIPKWFEEVQFRGLVHGGRITVSSVTDLESVTSLASMGATNEGTVAAQVMPEGAAVRFGFRFTLTRSPAGVSPQFASMRVKALPAFQREELLILPLLCFDEERDRFGAKGTQGKALDRYRRLRDLVVNGGRVLVQDMVTGESVLGVVDDLRFEQRKPPVGAAGFGGILTVTVRTMG